MEFSENPCKPFESERSLLCPMSPFSDTSFGWEEITPNTHSVSRDSSYVNGKVNVSNKFANECTNSNDNVYMTSDSSDSDDSIDDDEARFGVTAARKEESSVQDLVVKPDLPEKVLKDIYRMKKEHDVSESEDSYSQKSAKDNCKKKRKHVLKKEDSESDTEIPSLLTDEDYGTFKLGGTLKFGDLTEEEDIWMVQCPISLNPQCLEDKELVFGGTSEFTLQNSAHKYETTSYVDRIKPVLCLLPNKKGVYKANYEKELEVRKKVTSQNRRMVHEDLLIQPQMLKKEKRKKSRSSKSNSNSEETGTCKERGKWQTYDEEEQESYKKEKKKKGKNHDAEGHMRKRKLDEDTFEASEIVYDTKRRKKDKHKNMQ
ncbi:uncharacterized protein LOC110830970 isoform X2 [Zootermopsis nevadensis]|uniref:uncharacterized protein LOC110830970 isoform X2 n=1 Tax=Zootermopsis nevadensis TaxID=136037 RepID=UPI000B8E6458|nr:uncharacterized protein LOC110830970 isoform X2 [Zootermopsis nevadensis]